MTTNALILSTRQAIACRMPQLVRLPLETMDEPTLHQALNLIGHS